MILHAKITNKQSPSFSKKCASRFCRETTNENKQFKETKTWISNFYLIRKSLEGDCCESGNAIFAWRVTFNYAYSPFKPLRVVNLIEKYTVIKFSQKSFIENF